MAEYRLRGIRNDVLRRARARADSEGQDISQILIAALTVYADRAEQHARAGRAAAAALTSSERRERASHAATTRWERARAHTDGS